MNLLFLLLLFCISIDFCRSKKCEDTTTRGTVPSTVPTVTRKPPVGNNAPKPVINFDDPETTTVRTTSTRGTVGKVTSVKKITVATVTKTTEDIDQWRKLARVTVPTKTTVTPIKITRRVGSPGHGTVVKPATVPTRVTVPPMVTVTTTKSKKDDLRMPTVPLSTKTTKSPTTVRRVTVPLTTKTTTSRITVPTVRTTRKVPMGVNEKKKEPSFYFPHSEIINF